MCEGVNLGPPLDSRTLWTLGIFLRTEAYLPFSPFKPPLTPPFTIMTTRLILKRKAPVEAEDLDAVEPVDTEPAAKRLQSKKRFETVHGQKTVNEIMELREKGKLVIPKHQRGYKWKSPLPQDFIDTVLHNGVTLSIVFNETFDPATGEKKFYLENGFQRLTTIERFLRDEFRTLDGLLHSELSRKEQQYIQNYQFSVSTFLNASHKDIITQFERLNKGVTLTNWERIRTYMSYPGLSPIMTHAQELLYTPGRGYNGVITHLHRKADDDNSTQLYNTISLMAGCAFGSDAISRIWSVIKDYIERPVAVPHLTDRLRFVMEIYAGVIERIGGQKGATAFLKKLYDTSYTTAAILWSSENSDSDQADLTEAWITAIVNLFLNPELEKAFSSSKGSTAGSWNSKRWQARASLALGEEFQTDEPGETDEEEDDEDA